MKEEETQRSGDADETIFGKNAVLAYLEDLERQADILTGTPGEQPRRPSIGKILLAQADHPDSRLDRIESLARRQRIPVQVVDRRRLDKAAGAGARHQGVVAFIRAAEPWRLDDLLRMVDADRSARQAGGQSLDGYVVAMVDGIEDPHNLGAIIRSAEAAGVRAVVVAERRAAGLTATVARTSAGALATLPVVQVANLVNTIESLKKHGFWVVGLDGKADLLYTDADLKGQILVVIGSEGRGIGRLVREHCDFVVRLPMLGRVESLNASVAAGIFFYEVLRQNGMR